MSAFEPASDLAVSAAPVRVRPRKDKVRSVWISFTGRIVAQLVGALATVWLGLQFVQQGRWPSDAAALQAAAVRPSATGDKPSIAVLPFENLSGSESQAYLADGVTDALIIELSRSCEVRVVSRTSAAAYKGTHASVARIASDLGVGYVVEGALTRSGDRVRVTTQLIDAKTDAHVWARTHDAQLTDAIALQDSVARHTAAQVLASVASPAQADTRMGVDCTTPSRS